MTISVFERNYRENGVNLLIKNAFAGDEHAVKLLLELEKRDC